MHRMLAAAKQRSLRLAAFWQLQVVGTPAAGSQVSDRSVASGPNSAFLLAKMQVPRSFNETE
jgi:hypothetical protein